MKTHVDFEFSKAFGIHTKGDKLSLNRTFALELQGEKKVGKILGPTLTKHELENMEVRDAELLQTKKQLAEAEKELKVANNKLDKFVKQRATK